MKQYRKNVYRTAEDGIVPPAGFTIESTRIDDGIGTVDITGGEAGETIGLAFDMQPTGTFNSLNFDGITPIPVLDITHLNRTGDMVLDGSGNGTSNYVYEPDTADRACLVTVTSRSSGFTDGIGDTTNVT